MGTDLANGEEEDLALDILTGDDTVEDDDDDDDNNNGGCDDG